MPNDFTKDPNCVALWNFEHGALQTDSIGGNTWTAGGGSPQSDQANFKQGSAAIYLIGDADNDYYDIPDASLDAGFPCSSGESGIISLCFWYRLVAEPAGAGARECSVFVKSGDFKATWLTGLQYNAGGANARFFMKIGYNAGNDTEVIFHGSSIADAALFGKWYHVGMTFDDTDKSYRIRVWDDSNSTILGSDKTGTATNNMNIENAPLLLGKNSGGATPIADQIFDEMVVFKDILTADEIDLIRRGLYPGGIATKLHHYKHAGGL
jgi:hypothetical protein